MQITPHLSEKKVHTSGEIHPVVLNLLKKYFEEKKESGSFESYLADFFSWDLKSLPELTDLKDLTKAAERIILAIQRHEKIGIFGDYDVDGTTSCALFHFFFKSINYPVAIYQPGRFKEGYGLNPSSVLEAAKDNIKLLITVDCGITSDVAAVTALAEGIDLIVTDHHNDTLPEMVKAFAIVNPNRRDEKGASELKALAGVGVAFCLCLEVRNLLLKRGEACPSLYPLLQFVAIGTISDLAPINSVNRKLVRHGLKQMPKTEFCGIKVFLKPDERNSEFIISEKIAFNIGPLINAKGRLDHPEVAFQLLISESMDQAIGHYRILEINNNERKFIQGKIFSEAKAMAVKKIADDPNLRALVLYDPSWHEGVIGIVASKLVENFNLPALVFTKAEEAETLKASVRSILDLNIFNLLSECKPFFKKFGGHKMAAGLSLTPANFAPFEKFFLDLAATAVPKSSQRKHFDLEIDPQAIDKKLVDDLMTLEPFGPQNPRPIFRSHNLHLESYDILKEQHVRWNFILKNMPQKRLKGISFNYFDKVNYVHPEAVMKNQKFFIYYQVGINNFNGIAYLQLNVSHLEFIYE